MLAPIDKIRAGGNDILPIDITRRCQLNCSNCTRLLPFRHDARDMSLDVFRHAVECSKDWPGVLVLIGGNPCLHPQFEAICDILCELVPDQSRRGLWTNDLSGKGETARRTFFPHGRFNLNAHAVPSAVDAFNEWLPGIHVAGARESSHHATLLYDWRDDGLTEYEWAEKRERCDYNRDWSATIVERDGKPMAYFCEVAAFIDDVKGGSHGIPVEPDWWKWEMGRFADQVSGCCDAGCGGPLRHLGHRDDAEAYDISPSWSDYVQVRVPKRTKVVTHLEPPTDIGHRVTRYVGVR